MSILEHGINNNQNDIIQNLSIIELKQLLAKVNHDLKMNKPTIKRSKKAINNTISELAECNIIASRFTGKVYNKPVENAKLIADIQIQKDILDYMSNGGHIICSNTTGRLNSKPVKGARAGLKLFRKGFVV